MRVMSEKGDFVKPPGYDYETVAVSQTGQVLGAKGAVGDYLHSVVVSVITAATATVTIIDGTTSIIIITGGATVVPGVYTVALGIKSQNAGGWSITTGAGATALAIGLFS